MPQLAPLSWLFLSVTFWFLIVLVMSFLWWLQTPSISVLPISSPSSQVSKPWLW